MGDRVAEYLNMLIMLITVTAVITIGASFMYYGRRMENMFFDESTRIYVDMDTGPIRDLSVSDPLEMPAASALSFLYDNQKYIYDVFDTRDITTKEFADSGKLNSVSHLNKSTRNTYDVAKDTGDTREKFKVATSFLTGDMNKKCKIISKTTPLYTDYYDIYIHDIDCAKCDMEDDGSGTVGPYHTGSCKTCVKGDNHSGPCCSKNHTHDEINCEY